MDKKIREHITMDGNTAAAHVAYAFSEVAAIYPITPSSVMAEHIDAWATQDRRNIFGEQVKVQEMQSEGGASGAVHGALNAGSLTSTFTASQGLLLMIPNMYKIAGEELPAVFHVAARAISTQALSIFGDHSDVMGTRATGFGMIASNSPQEAMDLAAVAHLAAIKASLPILHFFDGFRTSHEQQKIAVWDYDTLSKMTDWDAVRRFKDHANNPFHPHSMGSAEQPEIFFQHNESRNAHYIKSIELIKETMDQVNDEIGTDYAPFNYYGAKDATEIMVAMGSVCEAAEEVIDYLNASGKKVGLVKVRLYRPFSVKYLIDVIPETVTSIAVLDRTKEPGSIGEPLYLDVLTALKGSAFNNAFVAHGRYGLGSKDTQPGDILALFKNLWSKSPKPEFTLSINDDVTYLSLKREYIPIVSPKSTVSCKFWGLGADGTVGANKNSIKIIGDHTDKHVQAYFQYDSKKSGGVTISHIRFADEPIRSTYYVDRADFIACHSAAYMSKYNIVQDVNPGGKFLLNCGWNDNELDQELDSATKKYIAENKINLYTCDAVNIATELGLGARRTNSVLQAAFFMLADIIPLDDAVEYMKDAIKKTYSRKGEDIVEMNYAAVDAGIKEVHKVKVTDKWLHLAEESKKAEIVTDRKELKSYIEDVLVPSNAMNGDSIPVSSFLETSDGAIPAGTAAYERRGVALRVPKWNPKKCIQCNLCSYVCPHAAIRPFALTDEDKEKSGAETIKANVDKTRNFMISVSAADCAGCGSCVDMCMAKEKAIEMIPISEADPEAQKLFDYAVANTNDKQMNVNTNTVVNVGFKKPLLEFSGACPGCGETPYAKLVTQLFGDRMFIANATGCSSIWGCSAPSTPYTLNNEGHGPAWSNSLFEDNAEFGLGMRISVNVRRNEMKSAVTVLAGSSIYKDAADKWLNNFDDDKISDTAGKELLDLCKQNPNNSQAQYVIANADMLPKPSMWIFGGDGWAYDIGYGGLDHTIASGENVNILVFDTEVYSNTGGQASKATPLGAIAQFAANGKALGKKDLAAMAMSYSYVYVAQVAMGANPNQTLKAIKEAEAYDGPSIIIAYSPCISHGIKAGMSKSMNEMKRAVNSGYWNLFRFDPRKKDNNENPLTIDSKQPTMDYEDFLNGEVRYNSLKISNPERAEMLFKKATELAKDRYDNLIARRESLEPDNK